jgi:hypothetical protein
MNRATLKNQLLAMKAEQSILTLLKTEGPQRPFIIGLRCMPKENKEGTHKQWAHKHLTYLLEKDLITTFKDRNDHVVYGIKDA